MKESDFQAKVIQYLKRKGCVVMKMPAGYQSIPTGFPDILALVDGGGWIALEVKVDEKSKFQPLQKQWVKKLDDMYFARVVHQNNFEEIKKELDKII